MRLRKRSRSGYRAINCAHSVARSSLPVVAKPWASRSRSMRSQSIAAMRSPMDDPVLRGVGADELPYLVDRMLTLVEHRRENLEDVDHIVPRLERDLHA